MKQDDYFHLNAAQGWLGLGDLASANDELEQMTPKFRNHPAVLTVRYEIYSMGKQWDEATEIAKALTQFLPDDPASWICLAYATRRKTDGGIPQAKGILTEARGKFPKEFLISFNLACYECRLGNLKAAKSRLKEAFDLAGQIDVRNMALDDPDLEPLRNEIRQI
jgi:predicted Zn-dependent protease